MDIKTKLKLRKFIKELESIRGRHTELVSVYVPVGYELIKIIQHLQQEQGTAKNIKDSRTRTNVIDSLEKMIRHLRIIDRTPAYGLAVFAGNASENESKVDIKVWSIEPPDKLNIRLYRCDQNFVLDPLKDMLLHEDVYGLIVMDKREATLGLLNGTSIQKLVHMTSDVPGKTKAGGQSAARFARIREGAAKEFFNRIGEAANKSLLPIKTQIKGIIIGGPTPTKETFFDGGYLNNELKLKVIGLKDLTYTDEQGLHYLVDKSADLLEKENITREKQLMEKFFQLLAKEPDKVAYGKDEVLRAIDMRAVDILLLSEGLGDEFIEDVSVRAEAYDTRVEIISIDLREGTQLMDLGGIAAILRYSIS